MAGLILEYGVDYMNEEGKNLYYSLKSTKENSMKSYPHQAHQQDYEEMKNLYDANLDETAEGNARLENFFTNFKGDPEALLFCAIDDGEVAIITDFITNKHIGANVEIYGTNPLIYACETGADFDIIDSLLDLGANPRFQVQGRSARKVLEGRVKNNEEDWDRILSNMTDSSVAPPPTAEEEEPNKKRIKWAENSVFTISEKGEKLNEKISNILKVNYVAGFVDAVNTALANEKISDLNIQNKTLLFAVFMNEAANNIFINEQMNSIRIGLVEDINKNNPEIIDFALAMSKQYHDLKKEGVKFQYRLAMINDDITEALAQKPVVAMPKGILKRTAPVAEDEENVSKKQRLADLYWKFYEELSELLAKQNNANSNEDCLGKIESKIAGFTLASDSDFKQIAILGIKQGNKNLVQLLVDKNLVEPSVLDLKILSATELPSPDNSASPNPVIEKGRIVGLPNSKGRSK